MQKYDIRQTSVMVTDGEGGAGRAIRGWFRQGRIDGAHQRAKNAKILLTPAGVHEVWNLWASHKGLDPDADMPSAVKKTVANFSPAITVEHSDSGPVVTVIVPIGVTVKVVQAA